MEKVEVQKDELLTILNDNMAAHTAIFEEAVQGYYDTMLRTIDQIRQEVLDGKIKEFSITLPAPEKHTRDYERAIRMVTMSVGDTIVLSEADFQSYVMDDWRWRRQFLASNSSYSIGATQALEDWPS